MSDEEIAKLTAPEINELIRKLLDALETELMELSWDREENNEDNRKNGKTD